MKLTFLFQLFFVITLPSLGFSKSETYNIDSLPCLDLIEHNSYKEVSYMQIAMDNLNTQNALNSDLTFDFPIQRPFYNHSFKFSSGFSINTLRLNNSMVEYNDTSEHQFEVNGNSPIMTFTHEMALDSCFSLSYTLGFSNSNIYYDHEYYGTRHYFISVNPQLFLIRKYNFECYFKLKIGVSYYDNRLDENPSEILQRIYPSKFQMYTGVTLLGINYLWNDHFALNSELSIWSPETINVGLSYRFFNHVKHKSPDFKKSLY